MGADLYESYVGSILSTGALAVAAGLGFAGITIPMVMAAVGILASIVGTFFVRTKEGATQRELLSALRRGTWISAALVAVAAFPLIWFGLGSKYVGFYFAVLSGLLAGILIGFFTEYYTSASYRPTKNLAGSSETGAGTVIISGLSLGMLSTVLPVVIVGVSVLVSYFVSGGAQSFDEGLYGVGISAVGMLSTLGITLATDAYGPVADNAGGIAEMAGLGEEVRERTDALDSLGNTTAATGKGFAIASAALTALALIASFIVQVKFIAPDFAFNLDITNPPVLVGLFLGGVLPFLFAAMTMSAVGRSAQSIVQEVRRQFREITGLMDGRAEPDYETCVDICTRSAQKEMLPPAVIAVAAPPGKYHSRHGKRVRHCLSSLDGSGADCFLYRAGEIYRAGLCFQSGYHKSSCAGRPVSRRSAAVPVCGDDYERGGTFRPKHCTRGPPAVPGNHGPDGRQGRA